jgi:hypothetical protein
MSVLRLLQRKTAQNKSYLVCRAPDPPSTSCRHGELSHPVLPQAKT